jgi:acetyl esterase/lipase
MPLTFDPEIAAVFAALAEAPDVPVTDRGDALGLREIADAGLVQMNEFAPDLPDVTRTDHVVPTADGSSILVRLYRTSSTLPGSAVVYAHGGGMICGSMASYDRLVAGYVEATGVPFLSVDYRLSPEFPGTTPVDDTFSALTWFVERADEFGVDPARIAIMGDSGGGGVAAGAAIAAREAGIPLARQILIYPMLDDRTVEPDVEILPFATWTYDNNFTGWNALLGEARGTADVSPRSAPARLADFAGLAPAFIDVGELDIFRDESVRYALELVRAGVSTELYVRPGVPHAFDRLAPTSSVGQRSWEDRHRAIQSL